MPLIWLSLAFLSGILIAANITYPVTIWLALAGAVCILASGHLIVRRLMFRHSGTRRKNFQYFAFNPPIPILLIALTLGAARYQANLPNISDRHFIAFYNDIDQTMVVTGVVVNFPDHRDTYTNLRVETERIHSANDVSAISVSGLLLVRVAPDEAFHYGDRIVLRGRIQTPPHAEEFSYREYLARQGIYSYMPINHAGLLDEHQGNSILSAIYALKEHSLATVYKLWPDPEASLFAGILLGVETGIPAPVQEAFKNTGTSHVIAISGFNITIIAGLFATFFGRIFNPRRAAIAAALGIAIYTILVGADAAVLRAALMGGLSLFARQVGRRQHGLTTLAFIAAIMALHNPHVPWDIGFQLSFAATLGLVLYADLFSQAFIHQASRLIPKSTAQKLAGPVGEYILFTLAAQLTTLPIMAYHFGRISLSAFLTNPVILPVQAPIMTIGGLALILGTIWLPLGKLIAPLAWPFVLFTIRVVEYFGLWRGGVLVLGDLGLLWVALFYGVLFGLTLGWSRSSRWMPAIKPLPIITALGILATLTWRSTLGAPDSLLHLTLLDVGTGDALLIQTPSGHYALIDGGPSTSLLSEALGRRLPPFQRELDWLIVASSTKEQVAALPRTLERFPPDAVLWAGPDSPARAADYLRETLTQSQIPNILALAGQSLDLGNGAQLHILTSGKRGAILLLEWENFRALLPLGAHEADYESLRMGQDIGPVTVLLLADNGYARLNPPAWINNLNPQLVLLSVAADDSAGRPDAGTLDALGGYSLLRTDQHGWIHISTNGEQMWVEIEK